ncbi:bifunctional DNA-formamidopyrimidine glycosylase/DNA-(apurinic or apyrimidinic site) lyase [Acetobacter farinalis]|uniref:Formamidopyrimidine-DNA glycosylase n=1 Tax=Acetobacter farinalis TaxID=1260984 RepID=A0ABT3Q551_9PROT|nr:bifunctional DNA-formamidopyrimidine glycosylase/DNA-(apurinic or apyrimidinic site) lyase [Acetobacter farinalis]MCX2560425.1 bifunctional DNA-formamidopyrimidine glycosylase/DNA-(apurinic or apyrimidinic site) lyase [Acetobacter farinalis]NHO29080.1 bifunctional DNA-formamidopyrimidine glycosylase/DNA-(apurinic or apyrimidinic site) lyase [Acetobacter farinalis]
MPELPEVETVMRGMQSALQDHVISDVILHRHDLRWQIPADFRQCVSGQTITGFRRRGKYILIRLSNNLSIVLHLGMSGRIVLDSPATPAPHEHVIFITADGRRCGFVDPRRFGMLDLIPTAQEDDYKFLAGMGPEPLEPAFTSAVLQAAFKGRKAPVKTVLLDQKTVSGLGNIYVCEALFRAGTHPQTASGSLKPREISGLVRAIRAVLTEAIAAGGSSLKDYVRPEGSLGYFQHAWRVYGKKGEPCPDCPGLPACTGVAHLTQAGRSTFFCPLQQKIR